MTDKTARKIVEDLWEKWSDFDPEPPTIKKLASAIQPIVAENERLKKTLDKTEKAMCQAQSCDCCDRTWAILQRF